MSKASPIALFYSSDDHYSHTFPNRSSVFPPTPGGFVPPDVATGLAWLHPPNSSSCCTLKPPPLLAAGTVAAFAGIGSGSPQPPESPHPPPGLLTAGAAAEDLKAEALVWEGAGAAEAIGAGAGSEDAQASFDPHASALLSPARGVVDDCA